MFARAATLAALALAALPGIAAAAPGDFDSSFGGDGVAGFQSPLLGAAVQPDGKLVAGGSVGSELVVVRFGADGSLDSSFGGPSGFRSSVGSVARGVAIQPDGKIVVAGTSGSGLLALRLNPNGTPDGSFSGDGFAFALSGSQGAQGLAVALQGGKVVVAGSAAIPSGGRAGFPGVAVARFNANGSPDASFGSGGARIYDFGRNSFANGVAIDSAGRIVLGGSQRDGLQATNVLAARLAPDGELDPSFGGNVGVPGLFVRDYARSAGFAAAFDVEVDAAGRVVLAGAASNGSSDPEGADAIAVRLTTGGAPDSSFSGDGIAYLPATTDKDSFSGDPFPGAYGLALGGNDIVLAGYLDQLGSKRLAVWALRADGTSDGGFGSGGRSLGPTGQFSALAIGSGGDLFGVGDTASPFGGSSGLAAKLSGVGPPVVPGPPPAGPPPPGPDPGPGPGPALCLGEEVTLPGTADGDVLRGTPGRDVIAGFGGVDRVIAKGGNDIVCGGSGNDTLLGNAGKDRIFGALGADELFGGAAADLLLGGLGADLLRGGRGLDTVKGGAGNDDSRQ
jgi:uncharacterized delta-60 repeat protein